MLKAGTTDLLTAAQSGDRRAAAKLISLAETSVNKGDVDRNELLDRVYQAAGRAHVLGVTGPPGAGKSSLVNAVAKELRGRGHRVGVVAIDPSSPFSGGAILGDRVRMGDLSADDGVFIRSLATQGAMGGLARTALDTVDVLDAVGYDTVVIETVGVGQDEVDVAAAAHTVIVASPPGLGDGIQAMKAGMLEIADIHVVTKADKPDAKTTAADLKNAAGLKGGGASAAWTTPVILTSANDGTGIADLCDAVAGHYRHLETAGELEARRKRSARARLLAAAEDRLRRAIRDLSAAVDDAVDRVAARELTPRNAAEGLICRAFSGKPEQS
ncbi:MAG: methylmalonyl Co-A mutase-associated GTPase MeaB [Rhodospirillaceae bacterium]